MRRPDVTFEVMTRIHVGMSDVDLVQVNFVRYFDWAGRALEALLEAFAHPVHDLVGQGMAVPIVRADCEYVSPVGLGDTLIQRTSLEGLGRSSFTLKSIFETGTSLSAVVRTTHVYVKLGNPATPTPLPKWLEAGRPPTPTDASAPSGTSSAAAGEFRLDAQGPPLGGLA